MPYFPVQSSSKEKELLQGGVQNLHLGEQPTKRSSQIKFFFLPLSDNMFCGLFKYRKSSLISLNIRSGTIFKNSDNYNVLYVNTQFLSLIC